MRFDAQDENALRLLGFTVTSTRDGEVAVLKGQMKIVLNAAGDQLAMAITLPDGSEIAATIPRAVLHEAAKNDGV